MKHFIFGLTAFLAVGLGLSPGIRADKPDKQAKADPARELAALQKEWSDAQQAFSKAIGEAKTDEERQKVQKEMQPKPAEFADRFLKLAETYPDSPEAVQAYVWVVGNAGGTDAGQKALPKLKEKLAATTDLAELHKGLVGLSVPAYNLTQLAPLVADKAKKHLDDPQAVPLLVWVCSATAYIDAIPDLAKLYTDTVDLLIDRFVERKELAPLAGLLFTDDDPPWAEKKLRRLMEKNSEESVKLGAKMGLASILKNKDEASQPEAEKLLQSVIDEFGKAPDKTLFVEQAKEELSEIQGPRGLGKAAPDIGSDDLDAKAFKLSDYKGKVILLDFWGFW
jgi:hypothetical protein